MTIGRVSRSNPSTVITSSRPGRVMRPGFFVNKYPRNIFWVTNLKHIHQNFIGQDGLKWWIGIVEDRNDPQQLGRARVRIHGYHTDDTSLIPTKELPWAFPIMPLDASGVSGVGATPSFMEGTVILGFWMDWPDCQVPAMLGSINQNEFHPSATQNGISSEGNTINDSVAGGPGTMSPTGNGPKWLQIARGELKKGVKEWSGSRHNPEVMKYGKELGFTTDDSSHPWCAAFVRWCVKKSGLPVTGMTGMAKSSLKASALESLATPLYGCIAVKHRSASAKNKPTGHVGFWVGRKGGKDLYLGGNQGNKVSIGSYSLSAHAGYRWPKGQPHSLADNKGEGKTDNSATVDNASQS